MYSEIKKNLKEAADKVNMDYLKTCFAKLNRIDNKIDWEMDDAREYEHADDFKELSELRDKVRKSYDEIYKFCEEHGIESNSLYDNAYSDKYYPDRWTWASDYYRDYRFSPDRALQG